MDVGATLDPEIRQRLYAGLFTSVAPLVVGALNTIIIALVAYLRSSQTVFLWIAAADTALLVLRMRALRHPGGAPDLLFAGGLSWTVMQGLTIVLVVTGGDTPMIIVTLASGLAAIGGIIGRNFAAPRYALAQTSIIDLSFKASFLAMDPEFTPLLAVQSVIFLALNVSIVRQQRATMIRALTGEIEGRTQSRIDPLTALLNRRGLEKAFACEGRSDRPVALFYLDLDGFKQVNDRLGHAAGDLLLTEVGERLRRCCDASSAICRLGGDEFLILTELADERAMQSLGVRLAKAVSQPYPIADSVLASVGVSIGIASGTRGHATLASLMAQADEALYRSKAQGKGRALLSRGESEDAAASPFLTQALAG